MSFVSGCQSSGDKRRMIMLRFQFNACRLFCTDINFVLFNSLQACTVIARKHSITSIRNRTRNRKEKNVWSTPSDSVPMRRTTVTKVQRVVRTHRSQVAFLMHSSCPPTFLQLSLNPHGVTSSVPVKSLHMLLINSRSLVPSTDSCAYLSSPQYFILKRRPLYLSKVSGLKIRCVT